MTGAWPETGGLACAAGIAAVLADLYLGSPSRRTSRGPGGESQDAVRRQRALSGWPRPALVGGAAVIASAAVGARIGPVLPAAACCCVVAASSALTACDLDERRLPDTITLPALGLTLVLLGAASWQAHDPKPLIRAVLAAAVSAGFFLALALATRAVGGGDVKLAALTGLPLGWLGWQHLVLGILAGLVLAALAAGILLAAHRISRRDPIPLGPFLAAGALMGMLA